MPNLRCELHHRICNLRYGTHGYGMISNGFLNIQMCSPPQMEVIYFSSSLRPSYTE